MKIRDVFPNSFEYAEGFRSIDWELDFDFSEVGLVSSVIGELRNIQEINCHVKGVDWSIEFSDVVLADIVKSKILCVLGKIS